MSLSILEPFYFSHFEFWPFVGHFVVFGVFSQLQQARCWVQDCLHLCEFDVLESTLIFWGGLQPGVSFMCIILPDALQDLADPAGLKGFWFPRVPWPIMRVCIGELWVSGMQGMQEHHL